MSDEEQARFTRQAMRKRVENSLTFRLTLHRLKTPMSGERLVHDLDELPLFVALGALSDEEAATWRERFMRAAEAFAAPDGDVVDEEQRARARGLLTDALAQYEASDPDVDREPFWRFPAVLRALKAVGAVSEDEASEWDRRFHEVLMRKSEPKRRARQRAAAGADKERSAKQRRYGAADLSRIVLGPPQRLGGVRVICAELYGDCVIVRWHRVLSAAETKRAERACADQLRPEELAARFGAALSLEDDVGTGYEVAVPSRITGDDAGTDNDKPIPVWGRSVFVPSVPRHARLLRAVNGLDTFEIRVT